MKRTALFTAAILAAAAVTACGDTSAMESIISEQESSSSEVDLADYYSDVLTASSGEEAFPNTSNGDVDIDLTQLSSSMVYGQVYDMVYSSENYVGKKVRAKGNFSYYKDPDNGNEYFAVLISDAAACCSQGIEFVLADADAVYPDDYPPLNTEITVEGSFNYYKENYSTYCQLQNATMQTELSW
ncbi:MAG: hypothetical protein IJ071_12785 [Ruminococcus sp.]|nr:hypothetical protein [Ruminococcus sp.]